MEQSYLSTSLQCSKYFVTAVENLTVFVQRKIRHDSRDSDLLFSDYCLKTVSNSHTPRTDWAIL